MEDALQTFERLRFPRTARVTRDSRRAGDLGQARGWRASLRNRILGLVPGGLLARQTRWLFDYEGVPLSPTGSVAT
jgi:hypothetical protein